MTLIYHANRAYLYCDPAEDRMPLVDKDDYDALAADLASEREAGLRCFEDKVKLEAILRDVAKREFDAMDGNDELWARIHLALETSGQRGVEP